MASQINDEYAITIENLTKSYKNIKVLDGLNLKVKRGTMLALLGPNGAGKTTTVRILSTLLKPDSGTVRVNGYDVVTQGHEVRSNIGLTGQYAAVDEFLTGYENLVMMGRLYHLSPANSVKRAHELLEQFDLVEAANRSTKTYSGGMRRRLDLAASLIATPQVLYLDEPTTGLDPRSRLAMWAVIKKLVEADVTILLTTQYLDEADQLADSIAVLDGGKIIAEGTADELKDKVGKERLVLTIKGDFEKAVAGIGNESTLTDATARTISIALDGGVTDVKQILDKLQALNIEIENLSMQKPTLDDVFMQLTGHHAEAKVEVDPK
ncbi:MAG: ATP-binding cassette domain-containing protein [Patescibacteria group bacterium]